jgi:hypothetical protein
VVVGGYEAWWCPVAAIEVLPSHQEGVGSSHVACLSSVVPPSSRDLITPPIERKLTGSFYLGTLPPPAGVGRYGVCDRGRLFAFSMQENISRKSLLVKYLE